jgi:cobyrinic acid a,c-diamide synthase
MSLVIAGERSGVGKTTITLALLSYLARQGYRVQSFKVGPDYIDPMFHTYVTKRYCRNLDPILTSESYVQSCFNYHCQGAEYALVEGVMGLFDGVPFQGRQSFASTAHVAQLIDLPVLLVLNCSSISISIGAIASGFRDFDPNLKIAGLVLNRVGSDRHLTLLKNALEGLNLPILGVFYRNQGLTIPDRHLGLIPTGEISNLHRILDELAELAQKSFDWEQLLPLLKTNSLETQTSLFEPISQTQPARIAVAYDQAFNFYYQDNLDLLQHHGAELVFWSPLNDQILPENVQAFYFGGGFPEVFAQQLADNITIRRSLYQTLTSGIPAYGECGGLMYLCQAIRDFNGVEHEMVGIFSPITVMGKGLTLGYRHSKTLLNNHFLKKNETLYGHEFHHSKLIQTSAQTEQNITEIKTIYGDTITNLEGMTKYNTYASYLHLHLGTNQIIAQRFCQRK